MTASFLCRGCYWAADTTRNAPQVWCAHAMHSGWQDSAPACAGVAFILRRPWHCAHRERETHDAGLAD